MEIIKTSGFHKIPETKTFLKKSFGALLIIIGMLALATPFTPGSWLIFIGLEFLGIRILFWNKIKAWLQKYSSKQTK